MRISESLAKTENALGVLRGLQILRAWNVFATRFFYFATPGSNNCEGEVWLEVECPWRIEKNERILAGSDDYGLRAEDNADPKWKPGEDQIGQLQDQKLEQIMGEIRNGAVFNTTAQLVVDAIKADALGGFQLFLSGGYILSVFPTTTSGMQWLLSRPRGGNFSLMDGCLAGSLGEPSRTA